MDRPAPSSVSQGTRGHAPGIIDILHRAEQSGNDNKTWDVCFEALTAQLVDDCNRVNATGGQDFALLHHAAAHGNSEACTTLLSRFCADPCIRTGSAGKTAVELATERGHKELASRLWKSQDECEQTLHMLLDAVKTHGGESSSWIMIYDFLQARCAANQRLTRSFGFLHHAAYWGNRGACLQLMEKFGADPTILSGNKQTPEQIAAAGGHTEVAALLRSWAGRGLTIPLARGGDVADSLQIVPGASPIAADRGEFRLQVRSGGRSLQGRYTFEMQARRVVVDGAVVGTFLDAPIASNPFPDDALKLGAGQTELRCVEVVSSEIMEEIQRPENAGAFFVLPSQLNGAEYPSHEAIVMEIDDYKYDRTGGPRGQLAVHPAAGQFILDNAGNTSRPNGVDATDVMLPRVRELASTADGRGYAMQMSNGYLTIPPCPEAAWDDVLHGLRGALHHLRCLGMEGVPACGLTPSHESFSAASHKVNLVYASAVPIDAYQNEMDRKVPAGWERTQDEQRRTCYYNASLNETINEHPNVEPHQHMVKFQTEVARLVLIGQYYGALRLAMDRSRVKPATIYLMPLGGGVFRNPPAIIAGAISAAIDLLVREGVDVEKQLRICLLAWRGNPQEAYGQASLLNACGKLSKRSTNFLREQAY